MWGPTANDYQGKLLMHKRSLVALLVLDRGCVGFAPAQRALLARDAIRGSL